MLSHCLDATLMALKRRKYPRGSRLLERESVICRRLKHPLAIGFREFHPGTVGEWVVRESVGSRALARHIRYPLASNEFRRRGATPNGRILAGIVLVMRCLHVPGVAEGDPPGDLLLGSDFGRSTSIDVPEWPFGNP
jgi:hypothetical protein